MDLHSPTFEIQLMSCHTFVLITRFRTCVMSRPASPRLNLLEHMSRTQVVSHMHSQSHIITSSVLSTFVNFWGMEDILVVAPNTSLARSDCWIQENLFEFCARVLAVQEWAVACLESITMIFDGITAISFWRRLKLVVHKFLHGFTWGWEGGKLFDCKLYKQYAQLEWKLFSMTQHVAVIVETAVSFESMICETELCILILKGNVE